VDLLERPVTQPRGKGPIPTLSDRDMGRREKALARMCDADAKRWCPRLGRALLGIDERRAKEAFVKGCREAKGKECHDPARLVRSAAHWQKLCKENASYGCARLATLVQHYDPARATRAVTHECTMRKLRDRDACVKLRLDGAPDPRAAALQEAREMGLIGMVGAPKEEALPLLSSSTPRKIEKGGRMRFGVVSGLKKDAIDALQQAAAEPLLECYRRYLAINPRLEGRVTAGFQLDGRGYPYQMKNAGSDLPDSNVVSCVLYALEAIHVAGPRGSMVVLPVMFSPQ
jgi:hypothetical protein